MPTPRKQPRSMILTLWKKPEQEAQEGKQAHALLRVRALVRRELRPRSVAASRLRELAS